MTKTNRITTKDLDRALSAHVQALESAGITYDGRLGIQQGSKAYGIAYRLYRTGYTVQEWDRETQTTQTRITSGHANPPVGSDYLGMTAAEAYHTLTTLTGAIYNVSDALRPNLPTTPEQEAGE